MSSGLLIMAAKCRIFKERVGGGWGNIVGWSISLQAWKLIAIDLHQPRRFTESIFGVVGHYGKAVVIWGQSVESVLGGKWVGDIDGLKL